MPDKELRHELIAAIARGEPVGPEAEDAPMLTMPAHVLREVLLEHSGQEDGTDLLWLRHVHIGDDLDLEAHPLHLRLRLEACRLDGPLILRQSSGSNIELVRCMLEQGLIADQLNLRWNLVLNESTIDNGVVLSGATIGGQLSLGAATLTGREEEDGSMTAALGGDGVEVPGGVFCRGLSATGEVRLLGARIGRLVLVEGKLEGHRDKTGAMRPAVNGTELEVKGAMFCARLVAHGEVRMIGAKVGGQLLLEEATLDDARGESDLAMPALNLSAVEVTGGLFCRRLSATGEVRMRGIKVGVQLSMEGAKLESHHDEQGTQMPALDADGADVAGALLWRKLSTKGEVRLVAARIGLQLAMEGAKLEAHRDGDGIAGSALLADRIEVAGGVFCRDLTTIGELRLTGARIGGQLSIGNVSLDATGAQRYGLSLNGTTADELILAPNRTNGVIDLRGTEVRTLWDAIDGRFAGQLPERLLLERFKYESLREPLDAKKRLEWVARSQRDNHIPGVYAELADAFRRIGRRADARRVGIANERRARKDSPWWSPRGLWSDLLFVTVGYGYRNWLALLWLLVPIGLGTAAFSICRGSFTHSGQDPPHLVPPLYAIDATIPILELGQTRWWSATEGLAWVELGLAVLGYALVAAVIAAAAGLFNRDQI
jgi:hypothetical protein